MCKKILAHGIRALHLYTLNMEKSALAILMVTPCTFWFSGLRSPVVGCLLLLSISKPF